MTSRGRWLRTGRPGSGRVARARRTCTSSGAICTDGYGISIRERKMPFKEEEAAIWDWLDSLPWTTEDTLELHFSW